MFRWTRWTTKPTLFVDIYYFNNVFKDIIFFVILNTTIQACTIVVLQTCL